MKTIESKDLVIGQEYYDIPNIDLRRATVLKFIGHDVKSKTIDFEYVRGVKDYVGTNAIPFGKHNKFYQP